MVKSILVLLGFFWAFSVDVMARVEEKKEPVNQNNLNRKVNTDLEKAVDEALQAIKKDSPQVSEDALRVWKNFSPTSRPVNFAYRFWGRRIILWLKEKKKMDFESAKQVGEVFEILERKKLISAHAVFVLMADAWSYLIYLEGVPSWEERMERQKAKERTGSGKDELKERAI